MLIDDPSKSLLETKHHDDAARHRQILANPGTSSAQGPWAHQLLTGIMQAW
jgi:hypothetical protein